MSPAFKKLLKISRTLHVYLTLFGLVVILFFAVTGFMLNHPHWFLPKELNLPPRSASIPLQLLQPLDKLAVVEFLRRECQVTGFLGGDPRELDRADDLDESPRETPRRLDWKSLFDEQATPVTLTFTQPGKTTTVDLWLVAETIPEAKPEDEIKPDTPPKELSKKAGDAIIRERSEGTAGVLLDLHKSKGSGYAWAWLIDITCGLLMVISATGLVLWSSLKTRGKRGALMMLLGALAALGVYLFGVPR